MGITKEMTKISVSSGKNNQSEAFALRLIEMIKELAVPENRIAIWKRPKFAYLDAKFPAGKLIENIIFVINGEGEMLAFITHKNNAKLRVRFYFDAEEYVPGYISKKISFDKAWEIFEGFLDPNEIWSGNKPKALGFKTIDPPSGPASGAYLSWSFFHLQIMGQVFKTGDFKEFVAVIKGKE